MTEPYAALLGALTAAPDVETFLCRAVRIAAEEVLPGTACGGAVRRDPHSWITAASCDFAVRVNDVAYGADEGPGLEAISTGTVVDVGDLAGEQRWPAYRPYAMILGVGSVLAVPLRAEPRMAAALMVFSAQRAAFDAPQRQRFEGFAGLCATALAQLHRISDLVEVEIQLRQALDSRGIIDQAIGIVMAQQRCAADTALGLLRAASQRRNRKLRELAADIVTRVGGQAPCPPSPFQIRQHAAHRDRSPSTSSATMRRP